MRPQLPALLLTAVALGASGCADADRAKEDARRAAREAEDAAHKAARDAEKAAHEAAKAAREAGKDVRQAVDEAKDAAREASRDAERATRDVRKEAREATSDVQEAGTVAHVKAAFAMSKELSTSLDISVAADEPGRTITLTGVAPTAAERTAAARIARETVPGYRVDNRIRVVPRRQ